MAILGLEHTIRLLLVPVGCWPVQGLATGLSFVPTPIIRLASTADIYAKRTHLQLTVDVQLLRLVPPIYVCVVWVCVCVTILGTCVRAVLDSSRFPSNPTKPKILRHNILRFVSVATGAAFGSTTVLSAKGVINVLSNDASEFYSTDSAWIAWFLLCWLALSVFFQL